MSFRRVFGRDTAALADDERALLSAVAPGRSLEDIAAAAGLEFGEATDILAHLESLGHVALGPRAPEDASAVIDFFAFASEAAAARKALVEDSAPSPASRTDASDPHHRPTVFDLATTRALAAQSADPDCGTADGDGARAMKSSGQMLRRDFVAALDALPTGVRQRG